MEIKNENLIAAYNAADESGKTMLRAMFPDLEWNKTENDNRPITERVKTYEDACNILGACPGELEQQWEEAGLTEPDEIAYQKLRIVVAALNEGWTPQFTEDEYRWMPWFWMYKSREEYDNDEDAGWREKHTYHDFKGEYQGDFSGFASANSYNAPSNARAIFGSRLCLKNSDLAEYCGKQFADLWADFLLIRK